MTSLTNQDYKTDQVIGEDDSDDTREFTISYNIEDDDWDQQ
jgi:hypothetical protein